VNSSGVTPSANPAMFIIYRDGDSWGLQQKLDGLVIARDLTNFHALALWHFLHGGRCVDVEVIEDMLMRDTA
jgi:hypothetical protein